MIHTKYRSRKTLYSIDVLFYFSDFQQHAQLSSPAYFRFKSTWNHFKFDRLVPRGKQMLSKKFETVGLLTSWL